MSDGTPQFDPQEAEMYAAIGAPARACPPLRLVLVAGQEVLPFEVDRQVRDHIEQCSLCQGLIADMATLPEVEITPAQMQRMASSAQTAAFPRLLSRWRPAYGAAAAVLLVAGAILFAHHRAAEPSAVFVAHAPSTPAHVEIAAALIPLSPLAPPETDASTMLTRGARAGVNPSVDEMLPAFQAYNKGDYARASRLFVPLTRAYPRGDIAPLYLAVSQLMQHDDDAAWATLSEMSPTVSPARADSVQWYKAIAAQRTHRDEAAAILATLCSKAHSSYATQSCQLIPKRQ